MKPRLTSMLDRCARDRTVYIDQFIAFNCLSLLNIIYKQLTSIDACNVSVRLCVRLHACTCMRACLRVCVRVYECECYMEKYAWIGIK